MTVGSLPEVPQGDVGPHITGKVDGDSVEAQQDVKQLCHVVVRFDLRGQGIPGEPRTLDKVTRNLLPGSLGVRHGVGVVAAHGAITLAQIGGVRQVLRTAAASDTQRPLTPRPMVDGEVWLAVRAREQRVALCLRPVWPQFSTSCRASGNQAWQAIAEHQGVRQIGHIP